MEVNYIEEFCHRNWYERCGVCTTQTDMGDCRVNEFHKFKEVKLTVCPFLAVCPCPLLRSSTTVPPGSFLFVVCHFQQMLLSLFHVHKSKNLHTNITVLSTRIYLKNPPHL